MIRLKLFNIGKKRDSHMEENFKTVFHELMYKFKKPWTELSFILYFILVIVLFGGLGVILFFFQEPIDKSNTYLCTSQNLLTYSIALLVPAFVSMLAQGLPNSKKKLSLIIISVTVLVIEGFVVCWCYFSGALLASIISTLLAWFFWVVVNYDNIYLKDETYDNSVRKGASKLSKNW